MWLGPCEAGKIKVCCYKGLAVAAAKSIHPGNRLAVMGCICWYLGKSKGARDLEALALDLELVRRDSHFPGNSIPCRRAFLREKGERMIVKEGIMDPLKANSSELSF